MKCDTIQNYMEHSGDIKLLYVQIKKNEKLKMVREKSTINNKTSNDCYFENPDFRNSDAKKTD
ncbi:hypothetical protein NQ314_006028 [Rhamnusium bicolor]|uniref:Uncharacterized protein n=1 Tax=Rhamnusium bicolor TaxID=1586634 RepID=A0AAV8Z9V1_9CUCU|nr:hypothetical protein NQ314_006028 [Rhamnusium bicolor]